MTMNNSPLAKMAALGLALAAAAPVANAAISLDRTRAVYLSDAKSISLNIVNENKELPFLASLGWKTNSTRKSRRLWWCCRHCSGLRPTNAA